MLLASLTISLRKIQINFVGNQNKCVYNFLKRSKASPSQCRQMSRVDCRIDHRTHTTPTALVLLAPGTEEQECVSIVNVLRRGFVQVTVAGVCGGGPVTCSNNSVIWPDTSMLEASKKVPYNVIVLPGGLEASEVFALSRDVGKLLKQQENNFGYIAAICAAPLALKAHNIGKGRCITSYPAMASDLQKSEIYQYKDDVPVVVDDKLITSRGPATALIFGFTILEQLQGRAAAEQVAKDMLYEY